MIPGPELSRWIADREAQRQTLARIEDSARKWVTHPLVQDVARDVREMSPRTPEKLLDAARRFLDRLAEFEVSFAEMVRHSSDDPFYRPPLAPVSSEIHSSLMLFDSPELSIGLGVTSVDNLAAKRIGRTGAASINFNGYVTLMRFVDAGGAVFSFWEAPRIEDNFVAAETGPCRLTGRRRIENGEELVIDGRYQSFVIDHAERDLVFYQAVARAQCAPVAAEYDCDSLAFIGASSTDEASSRVQLMVSLLRAMDRDDALPLFEQALEGWPFYTRWHVMREMLALDADAALPALRRMAANDPHSDIRAAAGRTLEMFFPEEAETGEGAVQCHS